MADSVASLDDWLKLATARVKATTLAPVSEQVGRVESIADGIAIVSGLPDVRLDEVLRFEHGQAAFAVTLDRDRLACVLLDPSRESRPGTVFGAPVKWPRYPSDRRCSAARSIRWDGRSTAAAEWRRTATSPSTVRRPRSSTAISSASRYRPGYSCSNSMFALGRGQRELIIGDRAIGKTAIAVDCIINQKSSDIICVYVAVGQKSSTVKRVINAI